MDEPVNPNVVGPTQGSAPNIQSSPLSQTQNQPIIQVPPSQNLSTAKLSMVPVIISLVGGVLYLALLVMNSLVLFRVVKFLNVTSPIGQQTLPMTILPVLALILIVFANFGFAFYLISKRKNGESVNKATLISLAITLPPILVQVAGYLLAMNLHKFI